VETTEIGTTHYKLFGSISCDEFVWKDIAEADWISPLRFPTADNEEGLKNARGFAVDALARIREYSIEDMEGWITESGRNRTLARVSNPGSDIVWNNPEDEAITNQTQQETNNTLPQLVTAWVTVPGDLTRLRVSARRGVGETTLFVEGTIYDLSSSQIQIPRRKHQRYFKILSTLELRDAARLALQEVYQQNDQPAPAEYKINVELKEGW
jgi:hypothetical protein